MPIDCGSSGLRLRSNVRIRTFAKKPAEEFKRKPCEKCGKEKGPREPTFCETCRDWFLDCIVHWRVRQAKKKGRLPF